ncbi:MAG: hypothetical protein AAFR35_15290 [Pseudomonadota bacterium]
MTKTILAAATAALLTVGAVPAVAMNQEHTMLVGAVFNELSRLGVDTSGINDLTLGQIAELKSILSGDSMSEAQQRSAVEAVLSGS